MYKICSRCKQEKLFSAFSKKSSSKDGLRSECKTCIKAYNTSNRDKIRERSAEYYAINKDKVLKNRAKYRMRNKDKIREYRINNKDSITAQRAEYSSANKGKNLEYRLANKARYIEYQKNYLISNRDKINAKTAKRRALKLKATPSWLTKTDFDQIAELYTCAQMFKLYTGQEYHVDHIVPLQGKNVCGLHVPWNLQVIPAKENVTKSNKLLD